MRNFVFVMNIPSPYRLHSLGETWRQLKERGIDFHCHFMAKGHKERPKSWLNPKIDFPHTYWFDCGVGQCHFNPGLVWHLCWNPPDIIHLGSPYDTLTCVLLAFFCRAKVICMGQEGNTKTPGRLDGLIGAFKRWVLCRGKFVTAPGADGVAYVALHQQRTSRKMPQPVVIPNLIDEKRFGRELFSEKDIFELRRNAFGAFNNERVCIIPARLEPVKGLIPFFNTVEPGLLKNWKIVIMGQGPLRQQITERIGERGLDKVVTILDYVSYKDMPRYYAASDLVLLPSIYDPNPLTAIEALHSGLPLALSDRAGNVEEAVTEGENGWRLPVLDAARYSAKLKEVFSSTFSDLRRMGQRSKMVNAKFWESKRAVCTWLDQILDDGQ